MFDFLEQTTLENIVRIYHAIDLVVEDNVSSKAQKDSASHHANEIYKVAMKRFPAEEWDTIHLRYLQPNWDTIHPRYLQPNWDSVPTDHD